MDLMAGPALRQFRKEIARKLQDYGLFRPTLPRRPRVPPVGRDADPDGYERFLQEEMAFQQRRRKKLDRQNLVWIIAGILLPLLLVVLKFLFF